MKLRYQSPQIEWSLMNEAFDLLAGSLDYDDLVAPGFGDDDWI